MGDPQMDGLSQTLAGFGLEQWVAIISAFLAVSSFLLSQRAVKRQEKMQLEALRAARDSDLIAWADAAIGGIASAQGFCRDCKNGLLDDAGQKRGQSDLRTQLSALLDRGRLFFPNQPDANEDEIAGEAAYAGVPHPAIDALYPIYRVISDLSRPEGLDPKSAVQAIVAQRRRFVSDVFRSIDPRRRDAALKNLGG